MAEVNHVIHPRQQHLAQGQPVDGGARLGRVEGRVRVTGGEDLVQLMVEGGAPRHVRAVRGSAEKLEEVAGEAAGECGCPVRVDAEAIALSPGDGRRVALVHGVFDAMPAQALSQAQSSDAAARDQYAYRHGRTSLAPVMPAPLAWERAVFLGCRSRSPGRAPSRAHV